ncbi:MAG: hypothetical protein HDS75_07610 [Bacteroidales bacterium]|nr:hypothetical protein [Bacteroidales bacterium]
MKHTIVNDITIPVAESYGDCMELVRSDYFRITGRRTGSWIKLWAMHFKSPSMGFQFFFRLCQHRGWLYPYFRLRMEKYRRKYAMLIPTEVRIGYGLYIGHDHSVVINASAVIGNNVNLSHCTTIGSMRGKAATIEDDVYAGPSVCIVEDVRIGRGSMIGAGAVVTADVPAGCSVGGVPARVLRGECGYSPVNPWPVPSADTAELRGRD